MRIKIKTLLLLAFFISVRGLSGQEVIDKLIAIVGDNIILQSELFQYSYTLAMQVGVDPQKEPEKFGDLRKETLTNLIAQKILLVKAKEDSVVVNDKQVDSVLEDQIKQMIRQAGSEEKVEEYFGMSIRQIKREFRKDIEERLLVDTIKNMRMQETKITRREVESFYRSNRDSLPELKETMNISHILLPVEPSESASSAAKEKIDDLLDRIKKGEDFAQLARQYSEDPGSAEKGGDLGMMDRGDLVKEFEEVAFGLEPGQISDAVKTQFGYHIIQLIKRVGEKINPRHILIRLESSDLDVQSTVDKINRLKVQILAGEITFAEAAEKYSTDETSNKKGGDLGWFQVDQFQIGSFKEAVSGLNKGDLSEPVSTKFGYHLIQVNDREPARELNIKNDWEQIESWALRIKSQQEFEKWLESAKKDIYIEIK